MIRPSKNLIIQRTFTFAHKVTIAKIIEKPMVFQWSDLRKTLLYKAFSRSEMEHGGGAYLTEIRLDVLIYQCRPAGAVCN